MQAEGEFAPGRDGWGPWRGGGGGRRRGSRGHGQAALSTKLVQNLTPGPLRTQRADLIGQKWRPSGDRTTGELHKPPQLHNNLIKPSSKQYLRWGKRVKSTLIQKEMGKRAIHHTVLYEFVCFSPLNEKSFGENVGLQHLICGCR